MVQTGLEKLLQDPQKFLKGSRVGLVTHPAAVTSRLVDAVTAFRSNDVDLRVLFGPEHGLYGMAADGARVEHGRDAHSGLCLYH